MRIRLRAIRFEREVGGDATGAAMFGLAHGTVRLAPAELHSIFAQRAITLLPHGAFIDGSVAGLASFGDGGFATCGVPLMARRDRRCRTPRPYRP